MISNTIPRICHNRSEESEIGRVFESGSNTNIIGQTTSDHCIHSLLTEKIFQWSSAWRRDNIILIHLWEGGSVRLSLPISYCLHSLTSALAHYPGMQSRNLHELSGPCEWNVRPDQMDDDDRDQRSTLTIWTSGSKLAPHDPCTQWVGYNTCNLGIDQLLNKKNENLCSWIEINETVLFSLEHIRDRRIERHRMASISCNQADELFFSDYAKFYCIARNKLLR